MRDRLKYSGPLILMAILTALQAGCAALSTPVPMATPADRTLSTTSPTSASPNMVTPMATGESSSSTVTTILLVRHAERLDDTWDTPLSDEGEQRAQALMHVAAEAGVGAIYATEFTRTHQTVLPLATYLELPVHHVDADKVEKLIQELMSEHAGEVILVAGHADTVPQMIAGLLEDTAPVPPLATYDSLYLVTHISNPDWPSGEVTVVRLQYGNPSEPDLPDNRESSSRMTTILLTRCPEPYSNGVERAQALAHAVEMAGMTAMYTPVQRVVRPSADHEGPTSTGYNPEDIPGLIGQVLLDHVGEVIGICGDYDTLFEIVEQLGGNPPPPISEDEHDRLLVITAYEPGRANVLSLQYGPPSP